MNEATVLRQEDIAFQSNLYGSANPTRRWLHNARREWINAAIDDIATTCTKSLEVGVGCGIFTRRLAEFGPVTGLDINEGFVRSVSEIRGVTARVCDIAQFDETAAYDLALCSEVIEHLPDSRPALANIFRALKPGGVLILTTPNAYSTTEMVARLLTVGWIVRFARWVYGEAVDDLGHINRLTRGQLTRQIEDAGFSILSSSDRGLYLPVVAEFGGAAGCRFAQLLESWMRRSKLFSHLLWTQCYVLQKPGND